MLADIIFEILLIGALIILNGFFAGAEAALIAVRRTRVNELAAKRGRSGQILKILKDTPDRFLATVQVGVTLVGTLASVVSGATIVRVLTPAIAEIPVPVIQRWSQGIAIAIVVTAIAFASLVIGELVPKYLALARPDKFALAVARPISIIAKVGHPLVILLTAVSRALTRLLGVKTDEGELSVSDQEIRHLVLEGRLHGSIDPTEHDLIHQALDFSDTLARQVMTPRPDIAAIDLSDDFAEVMKIIRQEGYSRYPVYENTIDQIKGILYTKDIIHLLHDNSPVVLSDIIRPAMFVPDSMPIAQVLNRFQAEHVHLAIVLDEFGGTAGLLTLEDILEEIVGEIQDEYDMEAEGFRMMPDGSALVVGGLSVIDFNEQFEADLPTDRADTIGGLVGAVLDRLPKPGDHVDISGIRLEVASREKRRTRLLRARRLESVGARVNGSDSAADR
ncbi:MAG: hemolysin family protein [Candidatus Zixiibacteriota bacterium]